MRLLLTALIMTAMALPLFGNAKAEPVKPQVKPVIMQTAQPTTIRHIRLKVRSNQVITSGY